MRSLTIRRRFILNAMQVSDSCPRPPTVYIRGGAWWAGPSLHERQPGGPGGAWLGGASNIEVEPASSD